MSFAFRRFVRYSMSASPGILPFASTSDTSHRTSLLFLPLIVAIWYASSVVAISTSKMVLNKANIPITLTLCQFMTACLTCTLLSPASLVKIRQLSSQASSLLLYSALAFTAGFIATNISFHMVNTSFAETIKAAEPVSSVLIGFLYLKQEASCRTYTTLLIICSGVALSCVGEYSFVFSGFAMAALSNICFSTRAVYTKLFYSSCSTSGSVISEIAFFAAITARGLVVLLPLALLAEMSTIYSLTTTTASMSELIFYLLINGIFFTTYNLMSYIVLTHAALVTHAVLNGFRRVVIIGTTAILFRVNLSHLNIVGVGLAVVGVLCYSLSKHADDLKSKV